MSTMKERIEALFELSADDLPPEAEAVFLEFRDMLTRGEVRAAEPTSSGWAVNGWVKKGILLGFRVGRIADLTPKDSSIAFFDKHTYPPRAMTLEEQVRVVPGGSSIRSGAFVASGVVCMPPMYVNVGAYVDEGTMIDSHALVGSCAQVGKDVHLSAAAQLGGVLEPVGAMPVIIEDRVLVGGNCGVYEGTVVQEEAVLAPGTLLTRSTPVYDLVKEEILRATRDTPLTIPSGAVVVPGSRPAKGKFAGDEGIQLYAPVIVKYRDRGTNAAVALEDALRP